MRNPQTSIKVVVADNQYFRTGLKMLLHRQVGDYIEILAEAENTDELIEIIDKQRPDVIIAAMRMPVLDGCEVSKIIRNKYPSIGIIAVSNFIDEKYIHAMYDAGVKGYLSKTASCQEIIFAIEAVYQGKMHYNNLTSNLLLNQIINHNQSKTYNATAFTKREIKVMNFICRQYAIKKIGCELNLSTRAVEEQIKKIKEKTHAENLVGIALYSIRHNIVSMHEISAGD